MDPVYEPRDSGHGNARENRPRSRSRSPRARRREDRSSRGHHERHARAAIPVALPLGANRLEKFDFDKYKPLFSSYLEIQKGLSLDSLGEGEIKGRWKSFTGKWNRGELAEGWYDSAMLDKAVRTARLPKEMDTLDQRPAVANADGLESEDDDFGPKMPASLRAIRNSSARRGPAIPSMQDLEVKSELVEQEAEDARSALRDERRAHRTREKQRLDELVPKAEAGTRERQLEKKREVASSNKAFAMAKEGGDMPEVAESDLMGGDEDDVATLKRRKKEMERQKSERELKREEISRAKREERERRQQEFKEREERTMQGFIELARRRFG